MKYTFALTDPRRNLSAVLSSEKSIKSYSYHVYFKIQELRFRGLKIWPIILWETRIFIDFPLFHMVCLREVKSNLQSRNEIDSRTGA